MPIRTCVVREEIHQAFTSALDVELPVYRGGVDGQDYPVGSTSQASSSALNRANHAQMRSAEMLTPSPRTMRCFSTCAPAQGRWRTC